jgi:hypothetical protein
VRGIRVTAPRDIQSAFLDGETAPGHEHIRLLGKGFAGRDSQSIHFADLRGQIAFQKGMVTSFSPV